MPDSIGRTGVKEISSGSAGAKGIYSIQTYQS
jgi:hypothetical protein